MRSDRIQILSPRLRISIHLPALTVNGGGDLKHGKKTF